MTKFTLAEFFQVSQRTIERWEKLGMPVVKIGGTVRYELNKILNWAETRGKRVN